MTFTLPQLWQLFLALCGSLATIAGAVAIVYNLYKSIKKPDTERDTTLKKHSEQLDNDNKRLKELEESNKIIMRSMLALMSHELDGNHTEELTKAKDELQEYLIRR